MHDVAAIHDQRVADHVGGVLRHQERHHARDFLDGAKAADRNVARALIQLTRSMALELSADGIAVNAVCPGPISTEGFIAGRNPGELEQRARDVPIGRFGTVEEVAGVVAFLVSKDAAYVIGHALVMDGGYIVH